MILESSGSTHLHDLGVGNWRIFKFHLAPEEYGGEVYRFLLRMEEGRPITAHNQEKRNLKLLN